MNIQQFSLKYQTIANKKSSITDFETSLHGVDGIVITKSLNSPSKIQITYDIKFDWEFFTLSDNTDFVFPNEVELNIRLGDEKGKKKDDRAFFGYLWEYEIREAQNPHLKLTYVDPLMLCSNKFSPKTYYKKELKEILEDTFKSAFEKLKKKPKIEINLKESIKFDEYMSFQRSSLELIDELARTYGLKYYFSHDNNVKDTIVLFRPDFKERPSSDNSLKREKLMGYTFQSTLGNMIDKMTLRTTANEEKTELEIKQVFSTISESFKKRKEHRDNSGIFSQRDFYLDNIPVEHMKPILEGQFLNHAFNCEKCEFATNQYLKVGEYVTIEGDDESKRTNGIYLIAESKSIYRPNDMDGGWQHIYQGIRP